jgi:hypothetical protein
MTAPFHAWSAGSDAPRRASDQSIVPVLTSSRARRRAGPLPRAAGRPAVAPPGAELAAGRAQRYLLSAWASSRPLRSHDIRAAPTSRFRVARLRARTRRRDGLSVWTRGRRTRGSPADDCLGRCCSSGCAAELSSRDSSQGVSGQRGRRRLPSNESGSDGVCARPRITGSLLTGASAWGCLPSRKVRLARGGLARGSRAALARWRRAVRRGRPPWRRTTRFRRRWG